MSTSSRPLLEVIACTVDDAVAAERGGADRIELVRDLGRGGLTPDIALTAAVVDAVRIPVRVMIREDEPFVVSDPEVSQALCDVAGGMSGLGYRRPRAGLPRRERQRGRGTARTRAARHAGRARHVSPGL